MTTPPLQLVYYRFPDAATWDAQGKAAGLLAQDGTPAVTSPEAIDVVGLIPVEPITEPPAFKVGFHVNALLTAPPEALDQFLVITNQAFRVFGGWPSAIPDDATLGGL